MWIYLAGFIDSFLSSYGFENNQKGARFYTDGSLLYYALMRDSLIEFEYGGTFIYSKKGNLKTLRFGNKQATYTMYADEKKDSVGIRIETKGKVYNWKCGKHYDPLSWIGESGNLYKFENVTMK